MHPESEFYSLSSKWYECAHKANQTPCPRRSPCNSILFSLLFWPESPYLLSAELRYLQLSMTECSWNFKLQLLLQQLLAYSVFSINNACWLIETKRSSLFLVSHFESFFLKTAEVWIVQNYHRDWTLNSLLNKIKTPNFELFLKIRGYYPIGVWFPFFHVYYPYMTMIPMAQIILATVASSSTCPSSLFGLWAPQPLLFFGCLSNGVHCWVATTSACQG